MLPGSVKWLRRPRIRHATHTPLPQEHAPPPAAASCTRLSQFLLAALLLAALVAGAAPSLGGVLAPVLFHLRSDTAANAAPTTVTVVSASPASAASLAAAAAAAPAAAAAAAAAAAPAAAAAAAPADAAAAAPAAAAAATTTSGAWPPPPLAWPPHRASPYSSHECTAGVQAFTRNYTTQNTHTSRFPHSEDTFMRVCLLRDVCFVQGELTYYVDPVLAFAVPPHLQPAALGPHLAYLGYQMSHFKRVFGAGERYKESFAPTYVEGPRPLTLRYAPGAATIHALGAFSFPNNWGHLLIDTVLPALSALEVFGYNHSDLQLLNLVTCATSHASSTPAEFSAQPGLTLGGMCEENLARWLAPAFAHPLLAPRDFEDACFSRLLVGHEPPFSLDGLYLHRASAARTLRVLLLRAYGLAHLEAPGVGLSIGAPHGIVVLVKAPQANTAYLPGLCVQVRAWAARLQQQGGSAGAAPIPIPVRCEHPALMPAAEQLALYASATVFVAENGSTGYATLLLGPGASFISVLGAQEEVAKESATLLHLPDVNVFYSSLADMEAMGEGTLLLAAERAGIRLGLPPAMLA